jgi:hypothetical protein
MTHLIEYPLEDGGSLLVQVQAPPSEGRIFEAARAGDVIEKAEETFEQALDSVKPAASAIIDKLRDLTDPPDEIEVAFGLTLNAKAGAVVASAGVAANYAITLTWKREAS